MPHLMCTALVKLLVFYVRAPADHISIQFSLDNWKVGKSLLCVAWKNKKLKKDRILSPS